MIRQVIYIQIVTRTEVSSESEITVSGTYARCIQGARVTGRRSRRALHEIISESSCTHLQSAFAFCTYSSTYLSTPHGSTENNAKFESHDL